MMSSVIPARLQFQCGHAALVTLPRVKGETATQRNDRVAREKTAALSRQCDFCAPSVAVLEPQAAAAAVNGNHVDVAVTEVVEVEERPVAELSLTYPSEPPMQTEHTPPPTDAEPAVPLIADVVEPEQGDVEVPEEVVVEAIITSHTEEPLAPAPQPARKPRARRQPPSPAAPKPTPTQPARAQRAPARRAAPQTAPSVGRQRFRVEYQVERVLRGATVHDVLRQLAGLGAADVIAVTRAD